MKDTQEIIQQVKKIEITTKNLVDGLITGNYHSIFKGQGIEFSEIRDYRPGDDIRSIDWKVTARFDHPFIKEFIEERDLQVYFAFDMSGSGSFGNFTSKRKRAIELTASLLFAAMRNNDKTGLFLMTNKVEKFLPARKGRKHTLKLLSNLISFEPKSKETDLNEALIYISKVLKKRSILFIISDFLTSDFYKPLRILRNKHDIIAINMGDAREIEIPDVGMIELEDEETGEQLLVDTSDPEFRKNYHKLIKNREKTLRGNLKKLKIDMVQLLTDEPYEVPLKKFFKIRKHRAVR